jgi:hypothetical protein
MNAGFPKWRTIHPRSSQRNLRQKAISANGARLNC